MSITEMFDAIEKKALELEEKDLLHGDASAIGYILMAGIMVAEEGK
jgi:hypothetical protein